MPVSNDIESLIKLSEQHGIDDEPDHEVGDLQTYLRVAFSLLSEAQKRAFFANGEVASTRASAMGDDDI